MKSSDNLGLLAKFCEPTVANGKVYMATFSGQLNIYGLLASGAAKKPSRALRAQATGRK
jgi:hypothetical protein